MGLDWHWIGAGLTHNCCPIGMELMSDWHRIGTGLTWDWNELTFDRHRIGAKLALDWHQIWTGFASYFDGLVIDWHQIDTGLGWIGTWMHPIGVKLASDWQRIDVGLTLDWHRIDNGLVTDWQRIGRGLTGIWWSMGRLDRIVLRRDTSVGSPVVHLFPGYLRNWPPIGIGLAWFVPMRAEPVSIHFLMIEAWDWGLIGVIFIDWHWIGTLVTDCQIGVESADW